MIRTNSNRLLYTQDKHRWSDEVIYGRSQILEKLAKGASLFEVLTTITQVAERIMPGMFCSVLLLDSEKRCLLHGAAPSLPEFYNKAINGILIGSNVGSCGAAAYLGKRVIVKDVMTHPNWKPFRELADRAGLRSCWSEPIFSSKREILGTLAMYYSVARKPDSSEIKLIRTAAQVAGIAIERKLYEEAIFRANNALETRVKQRSSALEEEIHQRKRANEEKECALGQLNERVKQLTCLYTIEKICRKEYSSIEDCLRQIVELIPPSLREPALVVSRIKYKDQVYSTPGFKTTPRMYRVSLFVNSERQGVLEISYLKKPRNQNIDGLVFVLEERSFLDVIATRVGTLIERKLMEVDRRESEKKLREMHSRLHFLLTSTPAVIYTCKPFGNFGATFISENIHSQLGYEPNLFTDNENFWAEHIHPDDKFRIFGDLKHALESHESQFEHDYRFRHRDGTYRWMHDHLRIVYDHKGNPTEIVGFWLDITPRKRLEHELRELPQKIIQAQENEREKISRDIHDDLGQSLATLKFYMQATMSKPAFQKVSINKPCLEFVQNLDDIMKKTQKVAYDLRPSRLEATNILQAIKSIINDFRCQKNLSIRFIHGRYKSLQLKGEIVNLYRIIQEALTNIAKHAHATKVHISLKRCGQQLIISIMDNGVGFLCDHNKSKEKTGSLGLTTMNERVRLLGGTITINSSPRRGTIIKIVVPLKQVRLVPAKQKGETVDILPHHSR